MGYLLSIIIPTKNRYEYLKECLYTLSQLNREEVEIIVQDNTKENDEIIQYIKELNLDNLKYFHDESELSQTANSDLAASHITGEYCTYIGDDDSVASVAIDVAKYLKKHDIDACVCNMATYHWPDVVFQGKKQPALFFDSRRCKIKTLDREKVLKSFLSWGCQDIHYMPRIYHGIIKSSVLKEIKEITGSFFPGPSPDMANATASILLVRTMIEVRLPIIISGFSFKSAGGMGLRGTHTGSLSSAKQLPPNAEKEWSSKIPKVWLGYTVWTESSEKAFIRMGKQEYVNKINYNAMFAKTFLRYPDNRRMVLESMRGVRRIALWWECLRFMLRWSANRINTIIRKKTSNEYENNSIISLAEACKIVNEHNEKMKERLIVRG